MEEYASGPSIAALVAKPKRCEDLIDAAYERMNEPTTPSKSIPARSKPSTHKAAVVIEPSSEPEHDEEEADEDDEASADEGADVDVAMEVDADVAGKGENMVGGEVQVKEEDLDEGEELFGEAVSAGRSTPQSAFSLEVDGLEIVSAPHTRSGSPELRTSRPPSSRSASVVSHG